MKLKGITLIELMVVMAIMAIFSLGVYNFSSAQFNIYKIQNAQTQLQYDAKNAANQISNDIKRSKIPTSIEEEGKKYVVTEDSGGFDGVKFSQLTQYTPKVYIITQQDNKTYLYALKNGTTKLVKITFNSDSDNLSIDQGTEKIIADNVKSVDVTSANSSNSAFNINVNLSKVVNGKNKPISRNFITCASRELYD